MSLLALNKHVELVDSYFLFNSPRNIRNKISSLGRDENVIEEEDDEQSDVRSNFDKTISDNSVVALNNNLEVRRGPDHEVSQYEKDQPDYEVFEEEKRPNGKKSKINI